MMPEPDWNTPARLNGLRPKKWNKRESTTRTGTMAELVEIWIQLPYHDRRSCDIGWGPNADGKHGTMGAETIARYVERHKLPPPMAARHQNSAAALAMLLKIPAEEFRPAQAHHFHDAAKVAKKPGADNG